MNFSDEQLSALYDLLHDKAFYGDDEIVYGDGPQAVMIRELLTIVTEEAKRRGFGWAK
jgi:hypothetical protein